MEQVYENDSYSDESDCEDLHIPQLADDVPGEADDELDRELQAAHAAGLLKGTLIRHVPAPKPQINNKAGLEQKLEDMQQTDLDWSERLDVTIDVTEYKTAGDDEDGAGSSQFDVNNDFKRELVFYEQAKSSSLFALDKLHKAGINTKRPEDYFAEMAKKDDHMKKLRQKLIVIQKRKEEAERNKKNFELRKYGKKVQQAVTLERQKKKRDMLNSVKKYQKGKSQKMDFLDEEGASASSGGKGQPKTTHLQKLTENLKANGKGKRAHRNKKFGFGGKKRNMKSNNSESHSNSSGFKRNVHSNKKNKRPGKNRRAQTKSRS